MLTGAQWKEQFKKATKDDVLGSLKKTMSDHFDNVGKRSARLFSTSGFKGTVKRGNRTQLGYKGKNNSGRLRVRTGDYKRSLEKRGGRSDGAVREIRVRGNVVHGEFGSDVTNNGFSYPYFHEFGNYPIVRPALSKEQKNFYKIFDKHWKRK